MYPRDIAIVSLLCILLATILNYYCSTYLTFPIIDNILYVRNISIYDKKNQSKIFWVTFLISSIFTLWVYFSTFALGLVSYYFILRTI